MRTAISLRESQKAEAQLKNTSQTQLQKQKEKPWYSGSEAVRKQKSKKPQEKNNRLDKAGQPTLGGVDGVLRKRGYYQTQTRHQNRRRQTQWKIRIP
jgi:cell division septum initiation protein DivIVA